MPQGDSVSSTTVVGPTAFTTTTTVVIGGAEPTATAPMEPEPEPQQTQTQSTSAKLSVTSPKAGRSLAKRSTASVDTSTAAQADQNAPPTPNTMMKVPFDSVFVPPVLDGAAADAGTLFVESNSCAHMYWFERVMFRNESYFSFTFAFGSAVCLR